MSLQAYNAFRREWSYERNEEKVILKRIEIKLIACQLFQQISKYELTSALRIFIQHGLNVNRQNTIGNTVLHSLVANCENEGNVKSKYWLRFFVNNGAKLLKNNNGENPLEYTHFNVKPKLQEYLRVLLQKRKTLKSVKRQKKSIPSLRSQSIYTMSTRDTKKGKDIMSHFHREKSPSTSPY